MACVDDALYSSCHFVSYRIYNFPHPLVLFFLSHLFATPYRAVLCYAIPCYSIISCVSSHAEQYCLLFEIEIEHTIFESRRLKYSVLSVFHFFPSVIYNFYRFSTRFLSLSLSLWYLTFGKSCFAYLDNYSWSNKF